MMRFPLRPGAVLILGLCLLGHSFASAYNARPKLIVILIIDQFRGDYLERYRDQFTEGGFRLFLEHGAYFTDCNYDYANTRTAPGHATLLTGAYANGHGILANEWWDPQKKGMVTSVQDEDTKLVGLTSTGAGASPHNLLADTLGDELKLATEGKARVLGIALKDRSAILSAGFAADGAYWIDHKTGIWITSTYYRHDLPKWLQDFNSSNRAEKYWNREWKDPSGKTLRTTAPQPGSTENFYEVIGSTPFANDYTLEFAKEAIVYEKLGDGPTTDLLVLSFSASDILGHHVGPDAPEVQAMVLALDRQLADFFSFLGHQLGLANVWLAISADHGVSPLPTVAKAMHIPAANLSQDKLRTQLNSLLTTRFSPGHPLEFVKGLDYPVAWLNQDAFAAVKSREDEAESGVGEAMAQLGFRGFFTRSQLARGAVPNTELGRQYLHSYSPKGGWYVLGVPQPYHVGDVEGTDHSSPYTYDRHVPLAFYGFPFHAGTYRTHSEPIDLAVTLASLLGINAPTHAVGRVLTEALTSNRTLAQAPVSRAEDSRPMPAGLTAGPGKAEDPPPRSAVQGGPR